MTLKDEWAEIDGELKKIVFGVWFDGAHEYDEEGVEEGTPIDPHEAIKQIKQLFATHTYKAVMGAVGEDDVQKYVPEYDYCDTCGFEPTDGTRHCVCTYRNDLRAEQRTQLKQLLEIPLKEE